MNFANVALITFFVAAPFLSHLGFDQSAHDVTRLAQLPVLAIFSLCLLYMTRLNAEPLRPPGRALIAFTAFLVLGAAAITAALSHSAALRELSLLLGLSCAVACVAQIDFHRNARFFIAALSVGTAVYAAIVFLIATAAVASGANLISGELFFGYDNYRFYNHVQTVSLPLAALAALIANTWLFRALGWSALILSFSLLLLGTGRATSLGFIGGCSLALVTCRRLSFRFVALMVTGAVGGALLYWALMKGLPLLLNLPPPLPLLGEVSNTGSYHARLYLWQLAVDYIRESPWLGIGPMHFANRVNIEAAHPHNIYLQIAAEWGLPILMLVIGVVGWSFWKFGQRIKACTVEADQTVGVGLLVACLAVAIDGFFSGNFVMPMSQMWIALLIGLSISWYRSPAQSAAVVGEQAVAAATRWFGHGRVGVAALLVVSQMWLLYDVYPEATRLSEHLERVQKDLAPNPRTNPRFWSHGWF